jgi:exosortase
MLTQVHTLISASLLVTLIGIIVYLAGVDAIKVLFTPLVLFSMLIPVPDQLFIQATFPLQMIVSQISEVMTQLVNIPTFREGNIINIPERSFEVVEACSGLRSITVLVTLSVIMGYFFLIKSTTKIALVVASLPTAIFSNIVRVVLMVVMFHYFKIDLTEGTPHIVAGLLIFLIAMSILYFTMKGLELCEKQSK